jgi:hypothetical protein
MFDNLRLNPVRSWLLPAWALAFLLGGCGGGGGEDEEEDEPTNPVTGWTQPPAPPAPAAAGATMEGIFRDSVVEGLDYSDGASFLGTTDAFGRFQYAQGRTVTFRLGGLTLGSLTGQPVMTPLHLIGASNTSISFAINNRLRLLQALDLDNNPNNGIRISNAVRAVAANWTTPNFDVDYAPFAAAVQPLLTEANAADGVTHTLPSDSAAATHFVRTAWCGYHGIYRGTYSGSDSGVWTMVVYGNGLIFGGGVSGPEREGFTLEKTTASGLSLFPAFTLGTVSTGASFSGRFDTQDLVSGTWSDTPGTGNFTGARAGGSKNAVYRIAGYQFPVGTALLIALEVDAANAVTGLILNRDFTGNGVPVTVSGTLVGSTFTATGTGYSINGTFNTADPASVRLTGTLVDSAQNRNVNLNLPGCKLN